MGKHQIARLSGALVVTMVPLAVTSLSQPQAFGAQPAAVAQPRVDVPLGQPTVTLDAQTALGSATTVPPQHIARRVTIRGMLDLTSHRKVEVNSPKGNLVVTASSLAEHDVPSAALTAYRNAAATLARQDPSCHIPWTLLAGIGRVESNHGRYGGSVLGSDGVSRPAIIGVPLNGNGVAAVPDTDNGKWDGDTVWDRAVGPMQFIPSTWASAGRDGDGDGVKSPNDINDAALASAAYLCSGSGDLRTAAGMKSAIFRYNPSTYYVALVMAFAQGYQSGVFAIPSPSAPAGSPAAKHHHKHQAATHTKHAKKPVKHVRHGSGSTSSPSPKPKPKPKPTHPPKPKPTHPPKPPTSKSVTFSGAWSSCGGSCWTMDGATLDLGPAAQLAATAAYDYDGDTSVETNSAEFGGLVAAGTSITVTGIETGKIVKVFTINNVAYRLATGAFTPPSLTSPSPSPSGPAPSPSSPSPSPSDSTGDSTGAAATPASDPTP